jgi:hypothetical protein
MLAVAVPQRCLAARRLLDAVPLAEHPAGRHVAEVGVVFNK